MNRLHSALLAALAADHPQPVDAIDLCEGMHRRGHLDDTMAGSMLVFMVLATELEEMGEIVSIQSIPEEKLSYKLTPAGVEGMNARLALVGLTLESLKHTVRNAVRRPA